MTLRVLFIIALILSVLLWSELQIRLLVLPLGEWSQCRRIWSPVKKLLFSRNGTISFQVCFLLFSPFLVFSCIWNGYYLIIVWWWCLCYLGNNELTEQKHDVSVLYVLDGLWRIGVNSFLSVGIQQWSRPGDSNMWLQHV